MCADLLGDVLGANSTLRYAFLTAAGWRPCVISFGGYGSQREVRVMGRVLMTEKNLGRVWLNQRRGWRQFFDSQVPSYPVLIRAGNAVKVVEADSGGYIDQHITGHGLEPGWHEVRVHLINRGDWQKHRRRLLEGMDPEHLSGSRLAARAKNLGVRIDSGVDIPVRIIGDFETTGIVSDIDDTIMVSMVPHKLLALRYMLLDKVSTRQTVPGMSYFLNRLQHHLHILEPAHKETEQLPPPFLFLSNGAWNTIPVLRHFLKRGEFPRATILLRPWGFSGIGFPTSGPTSKLSHLEDLTRMLPQVKWVLIGDNGQRDPEIFTEFGRRWPKNLAAVAIRTLLPLEHLTSHGTMKELSRLDQAKLPEGVPLIFGEDGYHLNRSASTMRFNKQLIDKLRA